MKLLLGISVLLLVALVVYTVRILFTESLYTHRNSYAYWICVSKTIRRVPEIGNASDVVFYCSAGDGPKPSVNAVSYVTDSPAEEVLRGLAQHFERLGISAHLPASHSDEEMSSSNSDPVEVVIEPVGVGHIKVTVTETR